MAAETAVGNQTEAAWKQAGDERRDIPPPTGDQLANPESERDRIRALMAPRPFNEDNGDRARLRAPPGTPAEEETPAAEERAPRQTFDAVADAEAAEKPPSRAAVKQDEAERAARAEEALGLRNGASLLPELPDQMVKIGGVEVPFSRIRRGLEAEAQRDKWQAELTQGQQALARANDTMIEAAREFTRDPVNALEKVGVPKTQLLEHLRRQGLLAESDAAPVSGTSVPELPEDADPLAKALLKENRGLKRRLESQDGEIAGIKRQIATESEKTRAAALRQQHAAALSGVNSDLIATAADVPAFKEATGKLNPEGKSLVRLTMTRLQQELGGFGQEVDPRQLAQRARAIFAEEAKEVGIPSRVQAARSAFSRQNAPVPTRVGTTIPPASDERGGKRKRFDFSNDEDRRDAMAKWFEENVAES